MAEKLSRYENLIVLEPIPATGLKLNKEKLTLQAGTSEKPSTLKKVLLSIYSKTLIVDPKSSLAAILPEGTASSYLTYASSNEKIATIDKYGMITPKQEGTVTITVKAFNGSKGQITLKVVKKR